MVGWHHWVSGHGFEQTPGDSEGQGSLACCSLGVSKSWTRLRDWAAITTTLLGSWLKAPYNKTDEQEKYKRIFIINNMCTSCIHGRYPENWVTPGNTSSHHLKYHLQGKTKERWWMGEGHLWEVTRKIIVNKGMIAAHIWVNAFSNDKSFEKFRIILLFQVQTRRHA